MTPNLKIKSDQVSFLQHFRNKFLLELLDLHIYISVNFHR